MNIKEYQEKAHITSRNTTIFGSKLLYPLFGLAGESGEIFEKIKKRFRDNADGKTMTDQELLADENFKTELKKELGDVLWYLQEVCTQWDISLQEVAETNIEKLYSRMNRNQITGSGDNR